MHSIDKDIVFGAIKPSETPTLANYISTIKNWIKFQKTHSCIFTVSDLQLINENGNIQDISTKSLDMLSLIIATGLEGERNNLYVQSSVSEHYELAWYLYNFVVNNDLSSEINKILGEKTKKNEYLDILTAADYLLYQAKIIPIGYNKEIFVNLARTIGERFNETYGVTFTLPNAYLDEYNYKVMGLQDVTKPMSRENVSDENNIIFITDEKDQVTSKINAVKIEANKPFIFDESNPNINNLLNIYKGISEKDRVEIEKEFEDCNEEQFKEAISSEINTTFKLIQMRYSLLKKNPDYIKTIINCNASVSSYAASKTIKQMKEALGLYL